MAVAGDGTSIAGYYTLAAASIARELLPPDDARRLPRYPVPAVILGRLAVDQRFQGAGLGQFLVFDAFTRILEASKVMAVYAVLVDAKSPQIMSFYERLGFRALPTQPLRLFIPLATLERAART